MENSTLLTPSQPPSTIEEVENLILDLYRPGAPIAKIQDTLQKLQRSTEGWQLASTLLENTDEKVQFFGALTFTVKLNSDSEALSETDAKVLLAHLISSLIKCLCQGNAASTLVIRKLCSTLVVFFLKFSSLWTKCVLHIVCSLAFDAAVPLESMNDETDIEILLQSLPASKASVALWFCTSLAEEVGKTDGNNIKHHKFHERLELNVTAVVALIGQGLTNTSISAQTKLQQDSMKCFQAWVLYSHRAFIDADILLDPLKSLTKTAISCVVLDNLYEVTIELFSDVLSNYSRFLRDEDIQLIFSILNSRWSRERYENLIQGDFSFESLQYGHFMIAFGDATVQDLVRKMDSESQQFLTTLAGLLGADGYAVADDHIFVHALEFWSTFVEVMIDSLYSTNDDQAFVPATNHIEAQTDKVSFTRGNIEDVARPWFSTAQSYVLLAIERCWRKIQFPRTQIFDTWDAVDKTGFADARKDVVDLLQSSYTLTGLSIFSMFGGMILQSLEAAAWQELEASLFCLGALADCISEGDATDGILNGIFGPLFTVLDDRALLVPPRTRQTTLSLIGQYGSYFERNVDFLPSALDFLFKALEAQNLAGTASRSIISLCSSCRQSLILALPMFFQHYAAFIFHGSPDSLVKERVIGAIAAVVQAIPLDVERKAPMEHLVELVETDFDRCHVLVSQGRLDEANSVGLEALRCLASMGKGLQAPSDIPVDLDNTEEPELLDQFWISGDGALAQHRIQEIIERLMIALPGNGDIVEAACSVYRAGFTERSPGPFVFRPGTVTDFILRATPSTPRLGAIITTACSLVNSQITDPAGAVGDSYHRLLSWLVLILQSFQEPTNETEVAQTGIDFICRLLPRYANILVGQASSSVEFVLMFTLKALAGPDPLPKSAAAEFWSQFVSLSNLSQPLQASVDGILEHFGPLLGEALVYNFSGNAARSELDKVSDPLKKLVVRQVRAKSWLESALFAKTPQSDKVEEGERKVFLQKIMSLRGARQTNQVVKDFWLACRGSSFAYAS